MPGGRKKNSKPPPRKPAASTSQPAKGLPAPENVEEIVDFVSPQGARYKILKTTEADAYDPPMPTPKKRGKSGGS